MRTTRELADYAYRTGYADIAPEVVERTKELALSTVGAAVYGVSMEPTTILVDYAKRLGAAGAVGVIGAGFATSADVAAMVSSSAAHNTELEDVALLEAMPTVNIVPTIVALGQALHASGRDVLAGIVLAFDLCARPSIELANAPDGLFARGFMPGAVLTPIGLAAVAAKMMGLEPEQIAHAIALSASQAGGIARQTGSGAHVVEPGIAARSAILSAEFAAAGMTGEATILEGPTGFWDAVGGHGDLDFPLGSGADFRIMQVGLKRYPCCYMLQRVIQGVVEIMAERHISAADVASVEVQGNEYFRRVMRQDRPETSSEARFSLPHAVALALSGDRIFFESFSVEAINNPRYRALWDKVRFARYPDWEGGTDQPESPIAVRLTDGTEIRRNATIHQGDPQDPLTRDQVAERFGFCVESVFSTERAEEIVARVYALDAEPDVAPLADLLTYPA
jgi:2-methylcitrate dehydratase PrpD